MLARSPMTVPAPMIARGPIDALGAIRAAGSTIADGWQPGSTGARGMEDRRDLRERRVGIRAQQLRKRRLGRHRRRQNHRRRARRGELVPVFGSRQKGDRAGAGRFERRHAGDLNGAVAFDSDAGESGEFGKGLRHGRLAMSDAATAGSALSPGDEFRRYLSASALITFSVMSILWLAKTTGSCRIRSNFSVSAICWITLFARS